MPICPRNYSFPSLSGTLERMIKIMYIQCSSGK
jgi:hypothetical protein